MTNEKSIRELVMEYFQAHPNQDLKHGPIVDWVESQYVAQGKEKPRDTWRAIRSLAQNGKLIKTSKGLYRYDPDYVREIPFCEDVFDVYDKHGIDTHVNRPDHR